LGSVKNKFNFIAEQLNQMKHDGITPAYIAAHRGKFDILLELARAGVDPKEPLSSAISSPIEEAIAKGCSEEMQRAINEAYEDYKKSKDPESETRIASATKIQSEREL
jgi:hypothetical protein